MKKSKIEIEVTLDEEKMPKEIKWSADNNPDGQVPRSCKAILLSFFDEEYKDTYKIDLWTKEFQTIEMDRFMFQTFKSLTDTYYKATKNAELANEMQRFVHYFGEKTGIITPEK